jgi:outer membrane protein assembly factor BamA
MSMSLVGLFVLHIAVSGETAPNTPGTCTHTNARGGRMTLSLDGDWPKWPERCVMLAQYLDLPEPPVTRDQVRNSARSLKALGYFDRVVCEEENTEQLVCELTPQNIVRSFSFAGQVPFALLQEDLRRRVFLRPGTLVPDLDDALARQSERLRAYLQGEGYFDAEVEVAPHPVGGAEPNRGLHLVITVTPGETAVVRNVTVDGDHVVDDAALGDVYRHWWFLGVPMRFRPSLLDEDTAAATELLQDEGWPAARVQASYRRDPNAAAVDLRLEVSSGPRPQLKFLGNTELSDSDLVDLATFRQSGAVDAVAAEDLRVAIVQRYQRKGFYAVDVEVETERPSAKVLALTYTIKAGPKAKVARVSFAGSVTFEAARLQKDVDLLTETSSFLFSRRWVDSWVEHDARALENYLREQGFAMAQVTANRKPLGDDGLEVVFQIDEGPRRMVERVALDGFPDAADPNDVMGRLQLREGRPFVAERVQTDGQEVQATLASRGYIHAQVTPDVEAPEPDTAGAARVVYRVEPGPQAHRGGLIVRGNFRTREATLAHEIPGSPGEVLDLPALGAARRRLRALNIFNNVQLTPLTVEPTDAVTWMLLSIEERQVRTLEGLLC